MSRSTPSETSSESPPSTSLSNALSGVELLPAVVEGWVAGGRRVPAAEFITPLADIQPARAKE